MLLKYLVGSGLMLALSGRIWAFEDTINIKIDSDNFSAKAETQEQCALAIATNFKDTLFKDSEKIKYKIETKLGKRKGLFEGKKIWYIVTEKGSDYSKTYSLSLRINFETVNEGPNSKKKKFSGKCSLNKNAQYPMYVMNQDDVMIAWIKGKSVAAAGAEKSVKAVVDLIWGK